MVSVVWGGVVRLLEGDSQGALLLGEPDLLLCVGGERVWGGQDGGLSVEAVLVSHVADLSH